MTTELPLENTPPQKSGKKWIWTLLLAVIVVVAVGGMVTWQQVRQGKILAAVDEACREAVTDWAKYPGGVSFPRELEFNRVEGDRDTWKSEGVVDFPNGWGTPVRQDFTCSVLLDGTEVLFPIASVTSRNED